VVPRPATLDSPGSFLEIQILVLYPRHPEPRKTECGAQQFVFRSPPGDSSAHYCVRTTGTEEGPPTRLLGQKKLSREVVSELISEEGVIQGKMFSGRVGLLLQEWKEREGMDRDSTVASLWARCAAQVILNSPPNRGSGV